MKTLKVNRLLPLLFLLAGWIGVNAQSTTSSTVEAEVPGDNFSLEGALELFKKSASPEEFEKMLNSSDSKVNNLDLNNDGQIDYVKVIDRNEGNVHAFILQAVLSETESQDVAVIELEKLADGKAVLQITGDADVYGIETIIEPTEEVRVNAGYTTDRATVNVWTWPSVQYVYSPYYSIWISPWTWAYHPFWWRPWVPIAYYSYYPFWRPYRPYYSLCYSHRIYFGGYRSYRMTSSIYYNNYRHQIHNYRTRNDYAHSGRDRYHGGGASGGRNRFEGYDRSHDRDRSFGHRYDGNSGRNGRNSDGVGHRYEANSNNSRTYTRSNNDRGRNSSNYEVVGRRSRDGQGSSDRYTQRSQGSTRSYEGRTQRSSTFEHKSVPQRGSGEYRAPRQSNPSINRGGGQIQRSAPSVGGGRSFGGGGRSSMPSAGHGGGSRGGSSGNGGGHSGGGHGGGHRH